MNHPQMHARLQACTYVRRTLRLHACVQRGLLGTVRCERILAPTAALPSPTNQPANLEHFHTHAGTAARVHACMQIARAQTRSGGEIIVDKYSSPWSVVLGRVDSAEAAPGRVPAPDASVEDIKVRMGMHACTHACCTAI